MAAAITPADGDGDRAGRRSVLVLAGEHAPLESVGSLVSALTEQGHQVRWAYAEGRVPPLRRDTARVGSGRVPAAPHRLVAARTPSRPRRVVLVVAPRVVDRRRRAVLAARFDPWFRRAVRDADHVVALDDAGAAMAELAAGLGVSPPVHAGSAGLADLVADLRVERLRGLAAQAHSTLAGFLPRRPAERLEPDSLAGLGRGLALLAQVAEQRSLLPDPGLVSLESADVPLHLLPGLTRAPDQVEDLVEGLTPVLGADDPVLTAFRVRAELDATGATDSDAVAVAARLLREVVDPALAPDPGLAPDPALAPDPVEATMVDGVVVDEVVDLVCLALDLAFHREQHSDSVDSRLIADPAAHLAPLGATQTWRLLTQPPPAQHPHPAEAATVRAAAARRPAARRVVVLPGPYGTFYQPLADALAVSAAVKVRVAEREEFRPHLLTMGSSPPVVRERLRAALGLSVGGYPQLSSLITSWDPDVLVVDWADKAAVLATLIAPPHTRVVLRVHGVDALRPWIHLLDWSRVDSVVAVSAPLLDLVRDAVGERAGTTPAHVIPNLIDLDAFGTRQATPREPQTLCVVGWAQRVKDPLWAVEVLAGLRAGGGDWRLLLVGADFAAAPTASGTEHAAAFRERALADDVRDHIEYTGFRTDLPEVLARPGFVLSTSLRESWPVGLAEGVAAGAVPVVRNWPMVAPRGGPRRLYPHEWVVDTVAEAVARIRSLADPGDRERAAEEATAVLGGLTDPEVTRTQWAELVLGDLGRLARLSAQHRHDEALALVRTVLDDPASPPAVLQQAAICAVLAGEPTLRLEALRRWAGEDPREPVLQLVRQQEGRLRELDPSWEPAVAAGALPAGPVDPVPGRVLHVLKVSLPHRQSGYALRSFYLLREQARAGADVSAVTVLDFPPAEDGGADADGPGGDGTGQPGTGQPGTGQLTTEVVGGVEHARLLREEIPRPEHSDEYLDAFATRLAEVVRDRRPAVIHAHSGHRGYDIVRAALAVGRAAGVPVVYEVRGFFEALWTSDLARAEIAELYHLRRAVETHCMVESAAVVTLSESMRQDILERRLPGAQDPAVDPARVFVVPNGMDAEVVTPRERRPDLMRRLGLEGSFVVGYVSNLDHPREGQELLIEAVGLLRAQGVPATALLVGGGERETLLRRLAADREVTDHVVFTGQVPHDEVSDYYALLDVFVVPRIDERAARLVTPLKPYEAMAMGLPVVVSDLPALLEIIGDGERGDSFPAGDAAGLARVLAALAQDPDRRRQLAERGRAWVVAERTWAAAAAVYQQVYDTVWSASP